MATEHLVHLSTQSLDILKRMTSLSDNQEMVFPSPFYPGKSLSDGTLNSALARLGYKGIATAHGFRTLFSTCANEAGWNSDVIEKQLSHEERDDVRRAYNRAQWLPERAKLMQWWANHLDSLRGVAKRPTESQSVRLGNTKGRDSPRSPKLQNAPSTVAAGRSRTSRAQASAAILQDAIADPIEVLRALVAALDQNAARKPH